MKRILFVLLFAKLYSCSSVTGPKKNAETQMIYSSVVKDSFLITIQKPDGYADTNQYKLILVADGAINLGRKVLNFCKTHPDSCKNDFIVVTISHLGDWKMKRRRDFIPSEISSNSTEEFGKAEAYYHFLKQEALPLIKRKIPNAIQHVFIGHSFTGLFSLYLSLKDSTLFHKYYAISPSCWANYNELLKIEQDYSTKNSSLTADLKIFAGGFEVLNKVLSSTTNYYQQVKSRNYTNLKIDFEVLENETHNSVVDPALKKIISEITQSTRNDN